MSCATSAKETSASCGHGRPASHPPLLPLQFFLTVRSRQANEAVLCQVSLAKTSTVPLAPLICTANMLRSSFRWRGRLIGGRRATERPDFDCRMMYQVTGMHFRMVPKAVNNPTVHLEARGSTTQERRSWKATCVDINTIYIVRQLWCSNVT
jgi:hypothetical protein